MNNKVIFIGSINWGNAADDGETMKNQILIDTLSKNNIDISIIDTRNRPKRILYLLKYILLITFCRRRKIIFSASSFVTYKLLQLASFFKINPNNIIYWVIGGKFADFVEQGQIDKKLYIPLKHIFVEGDSMTKKLNALGLNNVETFPNFKRISYIPQRPTNNDKIVKFVFLSRIIPQKGVDLIIDATKRLNKERKYSFIVDFYGKIESSYEADFLNKIESEVNINYRGFLNLTQNSGYDKLATYDVMLFPTFWDGEGFPGIIVDAYVAGLPIIGSNWNLNTQIIKDNVTGFIIPVQDLDALVNIMKQCIEGKVDLAQLSKNAQSEVWNYNADTIINKNLLRRIELL